MTTLNLYSYTQKKYVAAAACTEDSKCGSDNKVACCTHKRTSTNPETYGLKGTAGFCFNVAELSTNSSNTYDASFNYYKCDPKDMTAVKAGPTPAPTPEPPKATEPTLDPSRSWCKGATGNDQCKEAMKGKETCCASPYMDGKAAGENSQGLCVENGKDTFNGVDYKCHSANLMASISAAAMATYIMMY